MKYLIILIFVFTGCSKPIDYLKHPICKHTASQCKFKQSEHKISCLEEVVDCNLLLIEENFK